MNQRFKNILLVRTDRIGDVVLTTPAIKALRQMFPWARISILVAPLTKDLVTGNPYLDEVIIDDRCGVHKGLIGFFRLVFDLRSRDFDLVINYHTKKRTNFLCWAAGIPKRFGYKNEKFGFLLTNPIFDERHKGERHEAQYCLDVLDHLGAESILNKSYEALAEDICVPVSRQASEWAQQFCQEQNISERETLIAIHPGASDPAKYWPASQFAQLIAQLRHRYQARIILIGAASVKDITREIKSLSRFPILDLSGQTTIAQLAALLKRCNLLVSNDSGPVHMAAGVGTPVISIFTRNQPGINPQRWQPLGKFVRVLSVAPNPASEAGAKFSQAIPAQDVLEAVDAIFKLC